MFTDHTLTDDYGTLCAIAGDNPLAEYHRIRILLGMFWTPLECTWPQSGEFVEELNMRFSMQGHLRHVRE